MAISELAAKKIVIFGGEGQVGGCLRPHFASATFVSRRECDFAQPRAITALLTAHRPDLVINPAAYTNVDGAEKESEMAYRINTEAPGVIARWCAENGASLLHYSTDYVYDGSGETPWREDSPTGPLNQYGKSKLAGDQAVVAAGGHHIILRTSWLYSPGGVNFVKTMLRLGRERETLNVVTDQIGSPTSAADLALATAQICAHPQFQQQRGVFHATNSGFTSWHEFACEIFAQLRRRNVPLKIREVQPIPSSAYPAAARRPLNSRLNNAKIKAAFGIELQDWRQALRQQISLLDIRD